MNNQRFTNKVVLITGSAKGIGNNIAKAFGTEGAFVVLHDIDKNSGERAKREFMKNGIRCDFIQLDLSKTGSTKFLIKTILKKYNRLDMLINNARSGKRLGFFDENENTWEEGIAVTLKAAFFLSLEAVRCMAKNKKGCIINISTIEALLVGPDSPIYHIAKAGMLQMTRYLAQRVGGYGIRVNSVLPGFIVKDEDRDRFNNKNNRIYKFRANYCHPLGTIGTSDDVANAVLFLASEDASFITGQNLIVDGGLTLSEQSNLVLDFVQKDI